MKRNKLFLNMVIVGLMICIIGINDVGAANNPYKKTSSFGANCTWYAWQHVHDKAGISLPGWGNASTWYESAKKAGYSVGKTPKAKSVAVWSWVTGGKDYGHVGYVERVKGDKIYIWENTGGCIDPNDEEYNQCIANGVSEETDRICAQNAKRVACEYDATYWQEPGDLIGYIYLDAKPKTTKTTIKTTAKSITSTTNPSTSVKSNNTNLASLTVVGEDINFNKDILEYSIEVKYDRKNIEIDAKAEDKLSSVDGIGVHDLSFGENVLDISVTAEDGSIKKYTIKIMRKEIETTTTSKNTQKNNNVDKNKNNSDLTIYYVGGAILLVVIISLVITLIVKKRKKI